MKTRFFSPRLQVMACFALIVVCFALTTSVFAAGPAPAQAPSGPPKIWLGPSQPVQVTFTGAAAARASGVLAGTAPPQPAAMTQGDFDGDGISDLAVGYSFGGGGFIAIHRGNLDAFAPQSEASFQAIGRGEFPSPFLPEAQTFAVPISPDFIAAGNFTGMGNTDLVVAARGGSVVYVFAGDGKGNFTSGRAINLPGRVTNLAAGALGRSGSNVIIGVTNQQQSFLAVYGTGPQGLSPLAALPLSAPASNILFGDFGENGDVAFLSAGKVQILRPSLQLVSVSLPVSGTAMALGSFVYDRNGGSQIALLAADGSIHFVARAEFDPRPFSPEEVQARWKAAGRRGFGSPLDQPSTFPANGWKIIESIPGVGAVSASQPPVFFRTRISDHGADDIMWLNAGNGQMVVVSHADPQQGATTFLAGQVSVKPYNGSPVSGMPMRVNIDNRPGVIALHAGQLAPAAMMPLPDPTFFPNRFDDPTPTSPITNACNNTSNGDLSSSCSLREAILRANATAGTDTVSLAAGTYQLSLARVQNDCTGNHGALSVEDSVNIVGAGQNSTIIQAGTTSTNGVDMVMNVNEDLATANCPITNASASISNLTMRFGTNHGTVATFDGDGGCMEFDTGSSGNANLSLTNVTLSNCSTTDGNGGGLAAFNASSGLPAGGTGLVTVDTSLFTNNSVKEAAASAFGSGGGIMVFDLMHILINSGGTSITNNNATGSGAGIMIFSAGSGSRTSNLHGVTITGNIAQEDGGGLWTAANTVVDTSSLIDSNQATGANGGLGSGGGIRVGVASPDTVSLSKVTITNNQAKLSGAGIAVGSNSGGGGTTIAFSRLAGNTFLTSGTGTNLNNNHTTVTATNNWWGTNTPASTINNNVATTTFDPFIVLTHTASPSTIRINQSTTLTGDMSKDNHGNGAALAGNLDEIVGLPITFNNPILGTIPQAQPETLGNPVPTATATFNAGNTSGTGHADATVDQQTVTANIIILEPLRIIKSFSPDPVATNTASTLSFAVTNPNVIAVDANFTDTLPSGLVVFSTPGVTNTCGGTVTAAAGSGSISFSNASLAVGSCTITVKVSSAVDNVYNNSVTINSTAAGTGALSTSSASLTVIDPPSIAKAFGAATIPLNGTTSLTFTISSSNVNLTLNGIAFTDNLPSGLVVATPSNLNSTCSGTATATAGSSSASLTGASLAPGTSCTVSLNVQGTTAGVKNNSVQVTSTNAGTGNTSNATVTVVAPPTISKAFGAGSISLNGTTTTTFTINNPNTTVAGDLTGVAFSDTLPVSGGPGSATLVVSSTPNVTNTCGGTVTATAGTGVISLSGGSVAHNASCTLSVDVKGTVEGDANNTTGAITSTEGGTGTTSNTALLKVVAPPTISKAFGAAAIPLNATTTVTFTITNPASNTSAENGIAFSDTLTNGLQVASTPGVSNTCGGTVTAAANSTSISLTGGTIATPGATCTIVVNVTGTQSGTVSNTTGAVSSTNGGTGATSNTATLIVAAPATVTKTFAPTKIPLNGTTLLTINITNPNSNVTLSGLAFTDNLPAGLVVASPPNLSNTCGGTPTATAGASSVSLSGGTVAASASCAVSVNVQGTTAGDKLNSVQVSSTEGGPSATASATVTVVAPATISKAFGAGSIPLNGTTTTTFTINNPNTTAAGDLTGVAFSDTLPVSGGPGSATLVVAATPGVSNTCGGTVTATAGTGVISLSGGSVAHNSSCTLTVNVTGTVAGDANNTTGAISSTEGGTGTTSNTATVKVVAPPTISKAFGAANISLNGTTTLTFTITNPAANTSAENGIAFSDTLTNGLQVASTPGVSNTCGGTVTAAANTTTISLTGGSIATPGTSCTIVVNVTGTQSGTVSNTTGAVSSTNGGTGATSNTATLTVAAPPTSTKVFTLHQIPLNGTTTLTINITNPNSNVSLTGLSFTDSLPAGLVVASTPNLSNTCGGTATAVGGSGSVSLSGGTLAASASCAVSVDVQGTTAGVKVNSVTVSSTEGGSGTPSSDSLTVVGPQVIIKAFGAASIPLNGSTSLTFTIQNNNSTVAVSGVAFSDTLPAGLIISTPNGLTGSCGAGTITATQATNVISLSGGTIAASSSCTFSVNVTGTAAGQQNNTTGNVSSTEGGTGGTASASLNVVAPPSIAKAFNPTTIALNATTSLTFTITNPAGNAVSLTGVAFTDTLPTGLTVANASATVCGGTLTTTAPAGIALSGATIAVNSQCQFSVTVTGAASGNYTNTTGNVTSTNGGTGNTATANLTVASPPTITKSFGAAQIPLNGTTSLTFNLTNPNTNVALTGVGFTDNLPAGLVVASTPNLNNTCGGTATAVGGTGSVSLSGGTLATSASCTVSVNVQGTTAGIKNNSVQVTSTEGGTGNTSNASITVVGPPVIIKAFGAASIPLNGSTSLSFTIQNNNSTAASGVAFSDTLPAGLVISTPNGLTGSCGAGTITATQATNVISLSGGTISASSSCTFSVNVTGTAAGQQNNTTGNVSSTEGGTGGTASASVNVVAPPSIAKVFNPNTIALNATTSLTFTITNPAANAVAENGVAFTDILPTGLTVANASATVCGGTLTTTAPTGIALSGATIAVNSQCQFSVTVTGAAAGQYTNTTGAVSSTNGGTGNTASASLTVAQPPTISKSFSATAAGQNTTVFVNFTIVNPNSNPNPNLTLTGVSFTDSLPAGLTVANPNGVTSDCGGTVTAVAGSNSISLTGGAIDPGAPPPPIPGRRGAVVTRSAITRRAGPLVNAAGFCVVGVNLLVGPTATGILANTTGPVSANESGPGSPSNTATLEVIQAPTITKAFGAASVPLNGSTSLTFTFNNPNTSTPLVGTALNDALPSGLVVANPNGLGGTCSADVTANSGSGNIAIANLSLGASSSCTVIVNVTAATAGTKNNTTGQVTSTFDDGTGTFRPVTGGTASASLAVVAPPSIAKAFNPATVIVNGTSALTLTITNPAANAVAETGVAFTDTLPANLVVSTPNGLSSTCGGTVTATAGSGTISLTGGTVAVASSCTVTVNVTPSAVATYNNTTGAVSSTNGGTGNTATATLNVQTAHFGITKTHSGNFSRGQTGATYTITVSNVGQVATLGTVTVVDTLPAVPNTLVATAITGTGWSCTLGTLTCTRNDSLAPGASYPAITLTVNVPINIQANVTNKVTVTGGGDVSADSASDPTHIGPPIQLTFANSSATVTRGQSASFPFTLDSSPGLPPVTFSSSGVPPGALCTFSPPSSALLTDSITMNCTTSAPSASSAPMFRGGPTYALLFPALGLVGLVFVGKRGRKNSKTRLRWAMALSGLVLLLALAGCGGRPGFAGTPPGTYTITVTGSSGTTSGSATVNLNVQ